MMTGTVWDADIIIAGGGLVGLPLALALAGAGSDAGTGIAVAVIAKNRLGARPGPDRDARAFALSASSVAMLRVLGLWEEVEPHAQPVSEIIVTDSRLEDTNRSALLQFDNDTDMNRPGSYILESHRLLAALEQAVLDHPGIEVMNEKSVNGFAAGSTDITVMLDNGQELHVGLLLAADGRASRMRRLAGIKTLDWAASQQAIVTTIGLEVPHGGKAIQHFLPAGPFAILPLPGDRVSLVWTETPDNARAFMELDEPGFLAEVEKRMGTSFGALQLAGPRASYPLSMLVAREFVQARFALAGDAAHGMHWIAGQGLNYGLRGVAALAETIIDAHRLGLDIGSEAVLQRYERWRRFDSVSFTAAMAGLNTLFSNDNNLLRLVRDFGLGVVDRAPVLKRLFVNEAAGTSGDLPRLMRGKAI